MIEYTVTDTPRMRTIENKCRIVLGVRFGYTAIYEHWDIEYISLDGQGERSFPPGSDRGYYHGTFDFKSKVWNLTDSPMKLRLTFPDRSAMTKWVKKHQ